MRAILSILSVLICGVAFAGKPADDCRECLTRNFAAMNGEDVKMLMGTIAPSCPREAAAVFHDEAVKLFAETDVHLSLRDYQFLGVEMPFAAARVVQHTYVADGGVPTEYRQASKLLPAAEAVAYIQIFRKERGKWYVWRQQDEEVVSKDNSTTPVFGDCQNGACRRPPVTIAIE